MIALQGNGTYCQMALASLRQSSTLQPPGSTRHPPTSPQPFLLLSWPRDRSAACREPQRTCSAPLSSQMQMQVRLFVLDRLQPAVLD